MPCQSMVPRQERNERSTCCPDSLLYHDCSVFRSQIRIRFIGLELNGKFLLFLSLVHLVYIVNTSGFFSLDRTTEAKW